MGINMGAKLDDFENADFAYAPPFSTAIHPFVQAVYVLMNKIDGTIVSMTPAEYAAGKAEDIAWWMCSRNRLSGERSM